MAEANGAEASGARPPRLLFLVNEALFFTTHRMPVALEAQARGCEVHVAAPFDAGPVEIIRSRGFHYHDLPLKRGGRSLRGEARLLAHFFRLLRRLRPGLVHHVSMKPVIYGGLASRLLKVPAAIHAVTGLGFLFIREDLSARLIRRAIMPLYRYALGHPNARVIFQNPDDLALFLRRRLVREKVTVMIRGCGVDLQQFHPAPLPEGPPIVMFPARIIGDKGVHEFIEAARRLRRQGMEARFVLVGRRDPDNPTDVPEDVVNGWVEEGLVEWWGYRTDMPAVLAQASVVCMPSYREGLPRGLIEAAACGAPIVTADVPGCREVVAHAVTGLLVPVRDGAATAAAIGRLLAEPETRQRMAQAARQRAEREFSVEQFVADTLATYQAVLPDGPFGSAT
ncbi:MAG TPA: glycosyltransferase family 4 protein [Alphaproteobacteria bacterium]|nr:glycosyltransferase family 4 protein [Alphaproteobacteria bacterium]